LTVVLDSNVLVAMVTADRRAEAVGRHMRALDESGEALHAPCLLRHEVANALTRKIVAGEIDAADAARGWRQIVAMPIALHELEDGPTVIEIALRLERESAYDAAYVALAQEPRYRAADPRRAARPQRGERRSPRPPARGLTPGSHRPVRSEN
jgi:predicted nucleic acid-binding protein